MHKDNPSLVDPALDALPARPSAPDVWPDLDGALAAVRNDRGVITAFPQIETTQRSTGRWLLAGDIIALLTAFVMGGIFAWGTNIYVLNDTFQDLISAASLKEFLGFVGIGSAALMWLDQQGHYRLRLPFWEKMGHIIGVAVVGFIAGGFIQFAMKNDFSRLWLASSWVLFGILLFTSRVMVRRYLTAQGRWHIPTLLVGTGATAQAVERALNDESKMGYNIVGRVAGSDIARMSTPREWQLLLHEHGANTILLALEGAELEDAQRALKAAARGRIPYTMAPPWLGLPTNGLTPHTFFGHDVMLMHTTLRLQQPLPRFVKRSFDVVVSATALLLLSPVFAAITLMARSDGGPAFYTNLRTGIDGRRFGCLKFRSMLVNSDKILERHLAENPDAAAEWSEFQKLGDDPRITRFGQFIRKTSLDELPQLLNVLKGDMSLVGPRPILPEQAQFYGDDFTFYTAVRPGITGPWQVSGRNSLTFAQRVALECWYTRNWSLWMDIVILLKTPATLLRKDQTS